MLLPLTQSHVSGGATVYYTTHVNNEPKLNANPIRKNMNASEYY
jgi:hypothetical protein